MNPIGHFLSVPFTEALGWALVHSLWQGTLLALAVALVSRAFRRQPASTRYAVALSALALQTGAFGLTLALCYASTAPAGGLAFASMSPETAAATTPASLRTFLENHLDGLVLGWLAGVGVLAARLLGGWALVQRWARRSARPVAASWQTSLDQMRQSLGLQRAVSLLETARVSVPMTVGWLKPVVLLPLGLLSGLSPRQIEAILAHELAHVSRHDYLVNLIQSLADVLFFYHPALWWLSARVRAEREHCCDNVAVAVTGNRVALAQALAALETFRTVPMPALALAFGGRKTPLLDRVRRVLGGVETHSAPRQNAWVVGLCLLLAGGLAIGQSKQQPTPDVPPQPVLMPTVEAFAAPNPAPTPMPPPDLAPLLLPPPAPARPRTDTILTRAEFRRLDSLSKLMSRYLEQQKPELERLESQLTQAAANQSQRAFQVTQDKLALELARKNEQQRVLSLELTRLDRLKGQNSAERRRQKEHQLAQVEAQLTALEQQFSAETERMNPFWERSAVLSDSLSRLYEPISALSEQMAEVSARLAGLHDLLEAPRPDNEFELATQPLHPRPLPARSVKPVKAPRPPRPLQTPAAVSPVVAPTPTAASSPSPVVAPIPAMASSPNPRPAVAPRPARSRTPAATTPPRN
ncbi:MAG: M48 family metalloprotease [Sphingobacteriaceae bacterium]|nr:M48 family metalloprotease [Cytophagaceae bacterium]